MIHCCWASRLIAIVLCAAINMVCIHSFESIFFCPWDRYPKEGLKDHIYLMLSKHFFLPFH